MPNKINNIHDRFIKKLLSDKEIAVAFLEEYLPEEVTEVIDLQSIIYEDTPYLSKNLQSTFADLVWSAKSVNSFEVEVCVLLEHKSYPDNNVLFQILEYLASAYQKQLKSGKELKLIVPVLYYHGKTKWKLPDFKTHFEKHPEVLKKYLPTCKTEFVNLTSLTTEQIMTLQHGMLQSALLIQRHYFDADALNNQIGNIMQSLSPYLEKNLTDFIFVYLIQNGKVNKQQLRKALEPLPTDLNSKVMSIYDELIQEGIEKGIEKGMERGIIQSVLNGFDKGYSVNDLKVIFNLDETQLIAILKKNNREV